MKIFDFSKIKWDETSREFKYVKRVHSMLLKSTRFTSISEAVAFVEKQYGISIVSCQCFVRDMPETEEIELFID